MSKNNKKALRVLIGTVACVLLFTIGIFLYCDSKLHMQEVVVSKYSLSNRSQITEDEIEVIKVPSSYLSSEILTTKEEVLGKYVSIDTKIPKGSFFYKSALENYDSIKDKLNSELNENEVNFDLDVNNANINQAYLTKGMYVDLYLTINKDNKVDSDLLINNVKIIGLYDNKHQEIMDYDKSTILQSVCLAVPKESITYLYKAQVVGEISVVVGNNSYNNLDSVLNSNSSIFEYLNWWYD